MTKYFLIRQKCSQVSQMLLSMLQKPVWLIRSNLQTYLSVEFGCLKYFDRLESSMFPLLSHPELFMQSLLVQLKVRGHGIPGEQPYLSLENTRGRLPLDRTFQETFHQRNRRNILEMKFENKPSKSSRKTANILDEWKGYSESFFNLSFLELQKFLVIFPLYTLLQEINAP